MDQLKQKIKAFIDDKDVDNKMQLGELIDELNNDDLLYINAFLTQLNSDNNKHFIINIDRDGQSLAIETRCRIRRLY